MGATASVPKDIPLGCILINWSTYGYEPMTKKDDFYCHAVWPMYILDSGQRWPLNGSFIMLFCG